MRDSEVSPVESHFENRGAGKQSLTPHLFLPRSDTTAESGSPSNVRNALALWRCYTQLPAPSNGYTAGSVMSWECVAE
jgi:hypothetical protein